MKQYYDWIDSVRAICMILVYYVHCQDFSGIQYSLGHGLIASIYVNAFFIISGYLLLGKQLSKPLIEEDFNCYMKNGWKQGIVNILNRIAVPTIIFSTLFYLPKSLYANEPLGINSFLLQTIGGGTYWFTSALFVGELIVYLLLLSRKKDLWFYLAIGVFVSAISIYLCARYDALNQSRQPWSFMSGLLSIGLLSFGGLYKKYEHFFDKVSSKHLLLVIVILVFCLPVYYFPQFYKFSLASHNVNILGYLWCVPLSFVFFSVCKLLPRSGLLSFLGKNSLCLYLLSGVSPRISSALVLRFHLNHALSLSLIMVVAIIISCVAIQIINKMFPFLLDIRKINCKR